MAIMSAVCAVFALLGALFPLSAVFIMIVMPLVSIMVAVYCKARYYPIYLVAACTVSFLASFWEFQTTLFYIYPAIFTGIVYGFLLKRKCPSAFNVFLTSLVQFLFYLLSLLLIRALYGVDMRAFLIGLIGKGDDPYAYNIFPLFAFCYGLSQIGLSHLFFVTQIEKLGIEISKKRLEWIYPFLSTIFAGLCFGLVFVNSAIAYLFLGFCLYWTVFCFFPLVSNSRPIIWATLVILLLTSFFLIAAFYSKMGQDRGLILISIPCLSVSIVGFLNTLLLRKGKAKPKIEP